MLQRLVPGLRGILGDELIGLYLFGSLAVGDFDAANSDIDVLAVTARDLADDQLQSLQAFHADLFASGLPLADQVEGSYIPLAALRVYDPTNARHPHIDRGEATLRPQQHYTDWIIQRFSLRQYGLRLLGPSIQTLIDPITPATLRAAVLDLLHFWWEPMLGDTSHLQHTGYQAYAVVTFGRMLYTLEHGHVISKPAAGKWAMAHLDPRFASLIERALAYQLTTHDIPATQAFLRHTLELSRAYEIGRPGTPIPVTGA